MKKQFYFILFVLISLINARVAMSQTLTDIKGQPLKQIIYAEFEGSPFFSKVWSKGTVEMANGAKYTDLDLKYDQLKDGLVFKGKNDEELYFSDAIKKFTLNNTPDNGKQSVFRNGFEAYKDFTTQSFYEVITAGEISLLRKNFKTVIENREYNSANVIKKILNNNLLYIARDNKIIASQNDNIKVIANAIDANKSSSIIEFSSKNKLSPKKEEDLKKIIEYYTSIK